MGARRRDSKPSGHEALRCRHHYNESTAPDGSGQFATCRGWMHAGRPRRPDACANPIRLYGLVSLRIPRVFHRACQLSRRPRRALAPDRPRNVSQPLSVLAQDLRDHLRDGRRVRDRDVLPVRHELVGFFRPRRTGHRTVDGLRSAHGVLSRGRFPGRDALRPHARRARAAFHGDARRRRRHSRLGILDPVGEQLDAYPGRPLGQRRRAVRPRRLARDHLQPVDAISARAHGPRGVSHDIAGGRCGRSVSSAARSGQRRCAHDVLHGDVDGGARGADPGRGRRPARAQHARASAGEGDGDGRALRKPRGGCAARPRGPAGSGSGCGPPRRDDPARIVADPEARRGRAACGPRHRTARGLAAGCDRVLVLPRDGRARRPDPGARRMCARGPAARTSLRLTAPASLRDRDGARGVRRGPGRMGHDRSGAPAIHDPWPAPDRGFSCAARRAGGRRLAHGVCGGLPGRVRCRGLVSAQLDGARAASGEPGPEADPEKPTRTAGITPGPPTDRQRPTGRTHAESKRS